MIIAEKQILKYLHNGDLIKYGNRVEVVRRRGNKLSGDSCSIQNLLVILKGKDKEIYRKVGNDYILLFTYHNYRWKKIAQIDTEMIDMLVETEMEINQ